MKATTTFAIASLAAAAASGNAPAADSGRSVTVAAWATAYHAGEPFYHVIAGRRFVGTFASRQGTCSVNVLVGSIDETDTKAAPMRVTLRLNASQEAAISADARHSIGISCTTDAEALEIRTLTDPETVAARTN